MRLLFCSAGSVSEGGRVWMWGDIRFWQLGIPASRQASEPTQVDTLIHALKTILLPPQN